MKYDWELDERERERYMEKISFPSCSAHQSYIFFLTSGSRLCSGHICFLLYVFLFYFFTSGFRLSSGHTCFLLYIYSLLGLGSAAVCPLFYSVFIHFWISAQLSGSCSCFLFCVNSLLDLCLDPPLQFFILIPINLRAT